MPGRSKTRGTVRLRTQIERSAKTREKLIRAAIDVICDRGCANMSTLEVSARAGLSRGALQHQFRVRYDLLAAVGDQLTKNMLTLNDGLAIAGLSLESRLDLAIRHYWSIYMSKTFLAVIDINLGVKHNRRLQNQIRRHFENVYRESDKPWIALFSDTGISRARLVALRRVALATLRGLAVARFIGILSSSNKVELRLLKSMLIGELRIRGNPARY